MKLWGGVIKIVEILNQPKSECIEKPKLKEAMVNPLKPRIDSGLREMKDEFVIKEWL